MIDRFEPHSHTHYSNIRILDAISRPSTLVAYAHEIGLKGISITDHECLSASVEINKLQKEWEEKDKNFKIAIGNEIYLTEDRSKGQKYYHHILIAKDYEGHRQLRQMSSESWLQSYYDRGLERVPTTREELAAIVKRNPGHLVATTACIGGVLGQNILSMTKARTVGNKNDEVLSYNEIIRYLEYLKDIFGEDAYIEIAPAANQEQIIVNQKLVEIANFYNMKVVIGCDAHYLKKEDRYIHEAFLNSKGGEREVASFYEYAYLQTEEEIVNNITKSGLQGLYETFCKNSMEIYNKIENYDLSHPQTIPHVPVTNYPKENKNIEGCPVISAMFMSDDKSDRAWVHETVAALQKRGLWNKKEYRQRLEFEADIKKTVGDSLGTNIFNYPLVLKYYIDMMWDEGSTIGAGRGSSAGGLNHWLLGITQYDPIKWGLPFERYMNKDTVGLPDIDIDICPSKRPRIMKKIKAERAKRFEDGVSDIAKQHLGCTMVATFGTASSKRAIQIACKGYRSPEYPDGIDSDTSQYLSSLVAQERGFVYSISDTYYGNEEKNRVPSTIFKHEIDQYPKLLDIILGVEGLIVSRSSHASGVIMNDEDPYKFGCYMKTPVGEVITQYNLGDCETTGTTKYDFLVTSVQDKLCETIKMLQNDGEIECDMSLREVYDKYFNPEIIPFDDQETWENICRGKILDLFQFDSPVGAQGIKAIQPKNLRELSDTNGLIRLMAEEGKERPLDKYVRFKANPTLWYYEMEKTGLVKKDYLALERHLKKSNGVCISQEAIMWSLMDEDICGFSLKEANAARKVISKKKMDKLAALKEQVYEKATSEAMGKYVWEYIVLPSAGYGFSDLHALSYSMVGYQTAYIATKWNPIYWNTACLIVNSGSLDEDVSDIVEDEDGNGVVLTENDKESAVNYDKLAKAIGKVIEQGIKISLVDINKSENIFAPNADTGEILFGMKALSHIGNEIITKIVENRPYISLKDFMQKCPLTKVPMVNLIKAGAFDKLMDIEGVEPRTAAMIYYLWEVCDKKKRLTLQNLNGLIEKDLIPREEFEKEIEIFKINKILKKNKKDLYYLVPDAAAIDRVVDVDYEIVDAAAAILQTTWDAIYKKATAKIKPYIQQHHDELLNKVNQLAFKEMWDKYGKGNISSWEMEAMCFYYHPHELEGIDEDRYGIVNFKTLSPDSEADYFFKRNGRQIPVFKLSRIAGTVISKDNVRHTISLLTSHGVVNVKFTKDYYAMYQRQISELQMDGTKKIKEKSWFTRGTMLVITGYRRGDDFVAKRYSKTPGHTIYKIVQVNGNKLVLTSQRYGQEGEGNVEDIGK